MPVTCPKAPPRATRLERKPGPCRELVRGRDSRFKIQDSRFKIDAIRPGPCRELVKADTPLPAAAALCVRRVKVTDTPPADVPASSRRWLPLGLVPIAPVSSWGGRQRMELSLKTKF